MSRPARCVRASPGIRSLVFKPDTSTQLFKIRNLSNQQDDQRTSETIKHTQELIGCLHPSNRLDGQLDFLVAGYNTCSFSQQILRLVRIVRAQISLQVA